MNATIDRDRPRFTRDELTKLWPRLDLESQLTYNRLAKQDPLIAERYLRCQFNYLLGKYSVFEKADLTPNQLKILQQLKESGPVTAGALQLTLGIPMSAVYHYLGKLVELNLVENLGSTKVFSSVSGRTNTVDWIGLPGQKIPVDRLEDGRDYDREILQSLAEGEKTRSHLGRNLQIEQSRLRSRLKSLVKQGLIQASTPIGGQSHGGHQPIVYSLTALQQIIDQEDQS